jgi:predicted RNA-binding protein with PIN domain
MSLLLLIDGYNLSQPIAPSRNPDPRWLEKNRNVLLRDLTAHLSEPVRKKTCVVFDAANPPKNRPDRFTHNEMDVRFAVGYPTADDLLEEIIRAHHTPKRLMVVSSDHRVQTAAQRRNARFFDSEPWIDDLTDEKIHLAVPIPDAPDGAGQGGRKIGNGVESSAVAKKPRIQDPKEVEEWMREFGFDAD